MGTLAYSQFKPAWHLDRIEAMRSGVRPVPIHVQLVLSDLCNQDCNFCAYRMSSGLSRELFADGSVRNPNRRIPTDKALEIVGDCVDMGVRAIQFTGGGEPTVHKDHLQIFAAAQSGGVRTALVTNGQRLTDHTSNLAHDWVRVSVDAGTESTYAKTRGVSPSQWGKVWSNIESFSKAYKGNLSVGFVVTPDNYKEIDLAVIRARDSGVSGIRIGAVFSADGLGFYGDLIQSIAEACSRATRHSVDGFEVVDLFGRRIGDLEAGSPKSPQCRYQTITVYIGGDLSVYRCCNTAYTEIGRVGSLVSERFRDIQLAHEPFDARRCTACQFIGQNEALRTLVDKPQDVDFV